MAIYLLDNFGFDRLAADNGYNCRGNSLHGWFAEPVFRPTFDFCGRRPFVSAAYNSTLHKPRRTLRQLNNPSTASKCKVRCAADRGRSKLIDEQFDEFLRRLYPMDVERMARNNNREDVNNNNNNNNAEERTQAEPVTTTAAATAAVTVEEQQRQQTVEYTAKRIELDLQDFQPENVVVKVVDNQLLVEAVQEQKEDGLICKMEMKRRFQLPAQFELQKIQCLFTRDGKLKIDIPCAKQTRPESTVLPIQMEEERSPVEEEAQLAERADSSSADLPAANESSTMEE